MDARVTAPAHEPGPAAPSHPPAAEEPVGLEAFRAVDRMSETIVAQATGGLSPAALALAGFDWWIHLMAAPGKRAELGWKAGKKASRFGAQLLAQAMQGTPSPASSRCPATTVSPPRPGASRPFA